MATKDQFKASWVYLHEHDAELIRRDGLMCEQHPGLEFEHDPDCAGPGQSWRIEGKRQIQALIAGRDGSSEDAIKEEG